MSATDQDRYFREMARVGVSLGADPVPLSRAEAGGLIRSMRPQLLCDRRTREVARPVMTQKAPHAMAEPIQAIAMQAAIAARQSR